MKYILIYISTLICIASYVSCTNRNSHNTKQDKVVPASTDSTPLQITINNEDTFYQTTNLPLDSIDFRNMTYFIGDTAITLKNGIYDQTKNWADCKTLRIMSEMGVRNPDLIGYNVKIVELFFIGNACIGAYRSRNYILAFRKKSDKLVLTGKLEYHFNRPSSWSGDGPMVIYASNSDTNRIWTDLCVLSFNEGDIGIDKRIEIGEITKK